MDQEALAEERRLLYVAMTRARRKLLISHIMFGPDRVPVSASRFLQVRSSSPTSTSPPLLASPPLLCSPNPPLLTSSWPPLLTSSRFLQALPSELISRTSHFDLQNARLGNDYGGAQVTLG